MSPFDSTNQSVLFGSLYLIHDIKRYTKSIDMRVRIKLKEMIAHVFNHLNLPRHLDHITKMYTKFIYDCTIEMMYRKIEEQDGFIDVERFRIMFTLMLLINFERAFKTKISKKLFFNEVELRLRKNLINAMKNDLLETMECSSVLNRTAIMKL